MKTLTDIEVLLMDFERRYGLAVRGAQQLSEAWFNLKLGVVSSSKFDEACAKKGTATRDTYLAELVAQVCTGVIEEVNAKQMEWGRDHEDAARSSYELATGTVIAPVTFVFKDNSFRVGCSSDGFSGKVKPAEIKAPWKTANYIKFLTMGDLKGEWKYQTQGTLWVCDADEMDIAMFDPRMKAKPFHYLTVEKDPEFQKKFDDAIPELIHDMDKILASIGVKFGSHWIRIAQKLQESA